jgi:hypothetical protein
MEAHPADREPINARLTAGNEIDDLRSYIFLFFRLTGNCSTYKGVATPGEFCCHPIDWENQTVSQFGKPV